jgi:pyridoxamine 5'-phosphate oxidase
MEERPPFEEPYPWFVRWYDAARAAEMPDPNAIALATADADGRPSVRMVLLKEHAPGGFVFYTNLESRKGRELRENPHASFTMWWRELERQIRVEGPVRPVDPGRADAYFASRARGSQIGAWASQQSRPLSARARLLDEIEEVRDRFGADEDVPRPEFWSGFELRPLRYEFWSAGAHRLHDRWEFVRDELDDDWTVRRLYP